MTLVFHQDGPRAGEFDDLPPQELRTHLVYDGPRWLGVYSRSEPVRFQQTPRGRAEVWVART